jgi:hypothetical protein
MEDALFCAFNSIEPAYPERKLLHRGWLVGEWPMKYGAQGRLRRGEHGKQLQNGGMIWRAGAPATSEVRGGIVSNDWTCPVARQADRGEFRRTRCGACLAPHQRANGQSRRGPTSWPSAAKATIVKALTELSGRGGRSLLRRSRDRLTAFAPTGPFPADR